jgi:hypothetical protein
MSFKLTNSKETAIRAFIYEWLRDDTQYCNYCGSVFVKAPEGCVQDLCCDKPHIGTNVTFIYMLIQENKTIRESRANKFASNEDKTMRWGISITPRLLHDLEDYSINTLKEPLLKDKKEMDEFMRSFPEFCICEVV